MKNTMKYSYLVVLLLILVGMFYIGEKMPQSQDLTYSIAPDRPLSATYNKDDYCAPEINAESAQHSIALSEANSKISALERELSVLQTIVSGTPTPSPTETVTPTVSPSQGKLTPTPTPSEEAPAEVKKASSSAKE